MKKGVLMPEKVGEATFTWDDIFGYEDVKERAKALARRDEDILLIGESGVGKRLCANAIHNESKRRDKPFLTVEIPSIQASLLESELFGHKKGAFTDAKEDRAGIIESANSGTVFIDEVGDVSLEAQAKLLRVIEEKKLRRIGENFEREVDVRFIFATNKNLWKEVKSGRFRKDFLHRIEKNTLRIPPLRERREEIPIIARGLWERILKEKVREGIENRLMIKTYR